MKLNASQLLEKVLSLNATDLHLSVGSNPMIRVNRRLSPLEEGSPLLVGDVEFFLTQLMEKEQKDLFEVNRELDFSVSLGNKARFRVNAFYQRGYPSVALRSIPAHPPQIEELNLPKVINSLCELRQGLVLVVGPTGHGKSTTIAAMIQRINETRAEHVITIEDPIEYIFSNKLSLVEQREMFLDTHSWEISLKSILRQDPNVVMIGEMRDTETMSTALQIAETGHLVLTTLHTNSAAQSIDRIISSYPEEKRAEIRLQFSQVIEVIVSQRLLPSPVKGMVPAVELMLASDAIRNLIREGKTHLIDNMIGNSINMGMCPLDRSMAALVNEGLVEINEALRFSQRPDELRRIIKESKLMSK